MDHGDDPIEHGFLDRIRADPDDEATRAVYADWLEERSRPDEAELLRLQSTLRTMPTDDPAFRAGGERLRALATKVDQRWRTVVARVPIERCELRFDFVCPKQWDALRPTSEGDDVRFCDACAKNVHYSKTVTEAWAHARAGRCVVVDLVQLRRPGDLDPPPPILAAGAPVPYFPPREPPTETPTVIPPDAVPPPPPPPLPSGRTRTAPMPRVDVPPTTRIEPVARPIVVPPPETPEEPPPATLRMR